MLTTLAHDRYGDRYEGSPVTGATYDGARSNTTTPTAPGSSRQPHAGGDGLDGRAGDAGELATNLCEVDLVA